MRITHQGWNETVGIFHCEVTLDETRADHTILFSDGICYEQKTPFQPYETDWDRSGKPYSRFGAFFEQADNREFFTPLELASLMLHGQAYVAGLQIEDRQPDLGERLQAAALRSQALSVIQNPTSHARTASLQNL